MQQTNVAISQIILLGICLLALTGCVTFTDDVGFTAVQDTTQQYIKQKPIWANTQTLKAKNTKRVALLLAQTLNQERAVQIALLNNAQLQADFYELQVAESNLVQANRLPNPSFSMLYARTSSDYTIEQSVTMNIFALFTLSKATKIEKKRFAATQAKAAIRVLDIARSTRNAYINAVAANQTVEYLYQVNESAQATYQLAKRMREAGNWNVLDEGREQSFYTETALDLSQAQNRCIQAVEELTRLLGLSHPSAFRLPLRLESLPKTETNLIKIDEDDFSKRLDLRQIRINTESLAQQLGLTKTTRFINMLEFGPASVLEGSRNEPVKRGVELRFELPIFDWGTARVKRAEAIYQKALLSANNRAIQAASEVRAQYNQYQTSYQIARRYRDEIVPLRKKILDESLLRYNGMLMSPFELMSAAREQVITVNRYIASLKDFWISQSELEMVLAGKPIEEGVK